MFFAMQKGIEREGFGVDFAEKYSAYQEFKH